ncbi:MAG: hypothetical protein H0U57_09715 [Tatlockia sp.]|nr:hypothetical protein [Tatlockia sp.]
MQKNSTIDHYLMVTMGLFFFILVVNTSYFGGPLSDESLPIATSLRFINGQIPFIDDFSAFIPLGLLLYPLIKLSLWLHQGTNELILFLRHSYIAFVFLVTGYTFFLLRKKFPIFLCFFIFFGISIFHPFGINNFHYDTLATLLWSNSLFQFFCFQYLAEIKKIHLIIFSLTNLILCLAYPTFIFFLIPFYFIFYPLSRHSSKILFFHCLISIVASCGMMYVIFYYFDISTKHIGYFINFLHRLNLSNESLLNRFFELIQRLITNYALNLLIVSAVLSIAYIGKKNRLIFLSCFIFILLFPFFKINITQSNFNEIFFVLNYMAFLSFPLFLIFLRSNLEAKKLFFFIGIPSLAAGLLTSLTAHLLDLNLIIGFFPAALLAYIFIFFIFQNYFKDQLSFRFFVTRFVLILGLIELSFFQWNFIYSSPTSGIATYKNSIKVIEQNAFSGLYVDPTCYLIIRDLQNDLSKIDEFSKEFVYFGLFSAGYLFPSQLKPGEYILYSSPEQKHFGEKLRTPNYIFDFSKFWLTGPEVVNNRLNGINYKKIVKRQFYDIYASENSQVFKHLKP